MSCCERLIGLIYSLGQGLLRKLNFAKKRILENDNHFWKENIFLRVRDNFTHANAIAVQTKHGTNKL